MDNNKKESYQPFHYTEEGKKYFSKIIEKYGLKEDIEHLIIPLVNELGEEKESFIAKTKKLSLEDGSSVNLEEYIEQILNQETEKGFIIKTQEAQEEIAA